MRWQFILSKKDGLFTVTRLSVAFLHLILVAAGKNVSFDLFRRRFCRPLGEQEINGSRKLGGGWVHLQTNVPVKFPTFWRTTEATYASNVLCDVDSVGF
jgi:hypothetical protein